jgi:hypothetical protein
MRIYIDEAGAFVVPPRPHSYSLVLALMIPSASEEEILYEFLRLRDHWPSNEVEIKGSRLDESQAAQVIELLCRYDVLVKFFAVDMATHADWNVEDFKIRQAANVTVNVTPDHDPNLVSQLKKLARTIREMPNQLFLQAFVTIQLILDIIEEGTLFYAQRLPEEIGDIAWIVDRKNHTITQMEEMWTMLILPASQTHFTKKPLKVLLGADYSYFHARYGFTADTMGEEMARHMEWLHDTHGVRRMTGNDRGIDSKLLLSEQRKFMDSRDSLGLQLADMLATTLRRALNNRLQPQGWENFGKLLVHKAHPGSSFLQLGRDENAPRVLTGQAEQVCLLLNARAKSMLIDQD